MDMQIDIRPAIRAIRKEAHGLTASQVNTAIARALNHTAAKAKTRSARDIGNIYKIKKAEIKKNIVIGRAHRSRQSAAIIARGQPLPIMAFGARQVKSGVSANIMGTRKVIRGAFIATMKSGHKGVFARGQYAGYKFGFRTKRIRKTGNDLSINELTTTSLPKAFSNNTVLTNLKTMVESELPPRLMHEILRMKNGTASRP